MNFTKVALLGASAFLFLGCSSSPKDAVYGMFDALSDGNLKKLSEYATNSTVQLVTMGAAMKCTKNPNSYSKEEEYISECMEEVYGKVSVDSVEVVNETDTMASVIVTEDIDGKEAKENMSLMKVDGNWKVHINK